MQPIDDFGHFFNKERTVSVDGTPGKYTGPGLWDPSLDIIENLGSDVFLCIWRVEAGARKSRLENNEIQLRRDMSQRKVIQVPCHVALCTTRPYYIVSRGS